MALVSIREFSRALNTLEEALLRLKSAQAEQDYKIFRDASIQRFEFCVELSWKVSKKILGSSSTTAKPVIREMAQNNLIDDPQLWFEFIEALNKSSHSYDEEIAKQVLDVVFKFAPEAKSLLLKLSQK